MRQSGARLGGPGETAARRGRGDAVAREMALLGLGLFILCGVYVYPCLEGVAGAMMPGCLFHRITGLPCLLCGMTRSFVASAHGHVGEAFRLHLLGPPLFLCVAVVTVLLVLERVLSRRILPRPRTRAWERLGWGMLGLLTAAWVARMALLGSNL